MRPFVRESLPTERELFGDTPPDSPPILAMPPIAMPSDRDCLPNIITKVRVEKSSEMTTEQQEEVQVVSKNPRKRRKITVTKTISTHTSTVVVIESDTSDAD